MQRKIFSHSEFKIAGLMLSVVSLIAAIPAMSQQLPPAANAPQSPQNSSAGQEAGAPQSLHLLVGRSLVISSPTKIKRVSLADPEIAEAIVVSPTQVLVNGKKPGGVS